MYLIYLLQATYYFWICKIACLKSESVKQHPVSAICFGMFFQIKVSFFCIRILTITIFFKLEMNFIILL